MAPKGRRPTRAEGDRTRQVFWGCDIIPVPLSPDGTGRSKADARGTWPMRAERGRRAQDVVDARRRIAFGMLEFYGGSSS